MSAPAHPARSDDELAPDEPRTPLWLPLLGLCLFVAALGYLLATGEGADQQGAPAEPAAKEDKAAPAQQ